MVSSSLKMLGSRVMAPGEYIECLESVPCANDYIRNVDMFALPLLSRTSVVLVL